MYSFSLVILACGLMEWIICLCQSIKPWILPFIPFFSFLLFSITFSLTILSCTRIRFHHTFTKMTLTADGRSTTFERLLANRRSNNGNGDNKNNNNGDDDKKQQVKDPKKKKNLFDRRACKARDVPLERWCTSCDLCNFCSQRYVNIGGRVLFGLADVPKGEGQSHRAWIVQRESSARPLTPRYRPSPSAI